MDKRSADFLRFWITSCTSLIVLLSGASVMAAPGAPPQTITLDGRLFEDTDGKTPLLDANVSLKVQVLSADQTCALYEETISNINTVTTKGHFSVYVGSSTGASKRTGLDTGNAMSRVYSNADGLIDGKLLTNSGACSFDPTPGDVRYLRVTVTASRDNVARVLSPNMVLDSVPNATVAESLQGLSPENFLQTSASAPSLTQSHLETVFSSVNYPRLTALLSQDPNNYVLADPNGAAGLPTLSTNPTTGLLPGQFWYDSTPNVLKFYNGTTIETLGTSSGGITSLVAGTGLTGGTITTSGTIAVNVGTGPNQIVQLNGTSQLPAVSGALLTNVTATALSGTASINTTGTIASGNITSSGTITATGNVIGNGGSFRNLTLSNATNQQIQIVPPASITGAPLTLTLPATAGSNNQVLTTNGSGVLSWTTPASSGLSPTLNSANIFVGNGSNVATGVAVSGDISLANTGAATVTALRGQGISTTPATTGQFLEFDGTNWIGNLLRIGDIRSSAGAGTGAFLPAACTSGQTLNYNSVSDILECIALNPAGFGSQTQGTILAAPTGANGAPTFRTLASTDLPTAGTAGTYTSVTTDAYGRVTSGTNPTTVSGYGITDAVVNGGQNGAVTVGTNDANTLALETGGANRILINGTTGNVGIGTSPSATTKLEVSGSIYSNSTISAPNLRAIESGTAAYPSNGSTAVTTSGNPQFLFQRARGTSATSPLSIIDGDVIGRYQSRAHNGTDYQSTTGITFTVDGTNVTGSGDLPGGRMDFQVRGTSATGQFDTGINAMTIRNSGRIGVGTTTPSSILDVAGTVQIADGGEACSAAGDGGMIRYASNNLQFCNGSSWQTLGVSGSGVTSVTAASPLVSSGGATPEISLPAATTSASGYLTSTDWNTFNGKLSSTLTSANIFVGNGSNVATGVAVSGDVSLANTGAATVTALRGQGISTTPATTGQFLEFDGTNWIGNLLRIGDIRSSAGAGTGTFLPAACTSGQVLNYNSVTDILECIALNPAGFGSQTQGTILAAPTGASGAPTFRTLASTDLPTAGTAGTYRSVTTDAYGRVTSGTNPTTLSGYGITDSVTNGGQNGAVTVGSNDANSVTLESNGSPRMTILSDGNVGVGITNPTYVFQIYRNTNSDLSNGTLMIQNVNSGSDAAVGLNIGNDVGNIGGLTVGSSTYNDPLYRSRLALISSAANASGVNIVAANGAGDIRLLTGGSSSGYERARMDSSGNLAIGTTSPLGVLDISSGAIGVVVGADNNAKSRTNSTTKNALVGMAHYTNAEEPGTLIFGQSTATANIINIGGGTALSNSATSIRFHTGATSTTLTGSERMIISSAGDVGIGNSSPGEKLHVTGNVRADSFIMSSDRRLKTNIESSSGLDLIRKMRGTKYIRIASGKSEYGLIAQEIEKVAPEFVVTDSSTGLKGVQYQSLIAPLIEATKEIDNQCRKTDLELKEELIAVKIENERLQKQNLILQEEVQKLKATQISDSARIQNIEILLEKLSRKSGQ